MDFTQELRQHNLKVTSQRLKLSNILCTHGHLSIEQLYEEMHREIPSISLATIYKNVNKMVENGFLTQVAMTTEKSVYEINKAEHSHLHCVVCHTVEDITLPLEAVSLVASEKSGFAITSNSLVFDGVCSECQKRSDTQQQ